MKQRRRNGKSEKERLEYIRETLQKQRAKREKRHRDP